MIVEERAYSVPDIIQGKERFHTHFPILIHRLHESSTELNGVRQELTHEALRIVEEMRRGDVRLTVSYLGFRAEQVTVTSHDLPVLGIPNDQLMVRTIHGIHVVHVHLFSGRTSSFTVTDLTQTCNLTHHIGALMCRNVVDQVVRLIGRAKQVSFQFAH